MPPDQALRCAPAPGASYFIPAVYLLSCILPVPAPAQYGQGNGSQAGQRQETDPEAGCRIVSGLWAVFPGRAAGCGGSAAGLLAAGTACSASSASTARGCTIPVLRTSVRPVFRSVGWQFINHGILL